MRLLLCIATTALAAALPLAHAAQTEPHAPAAPDKPWVRAGQGAPDKTGGELGRTDRKFIEAAAESGMAEVAAAQLALQRAHNPRVHDYAQRLVQDHEAANAQLQRMAASKGLALPTGPSREQQRGLKDLQKKQGDDFDQAFLSRMVRDHQKAIDLFGHEVKGRHQDGDLKNFAQQTLLVLERHMAQATQIQKDSGHLPG